MKTLNQYIEEQMKDEEFSKAYHATELCVMRTIISARIARNMTQQELAKKTGIAQTEISRIENGSRNPSLKILERLADGLDMDLEISFVPRE